MYVTVFQILYRLDPNDCIFIIFHFVLNKVQVATYSHKSIDHTSQILQE